MSYGSKHFRCGLLMTNISAYYFKFDTTSIAVSQFCDCHPIWDATTLKMRGEVKLTFLI